MAIETKPTSAAEVTFPITGMTCASCVRRVEDALRGVPGVAEASVNLATERAKVVFDPTATTVEALGAAVERALKKFEAALLEGHLQSCVPAGFREGRDAEMVRELAELFELSRK